MRRSGCCTFLPICAPGVRRGDLRFHVRLARGAVSHPGNRAARHARNLCQPDDPRRMRWRFCERAMACGWRVIVGGPEPANYAERVSRPRALTSWFRVKASWRWKRSSTARRCQIPGLWLPRGWRASHRPRAAAPRPRRAALARPRAHRYRADTCAPGASTTARDRSPLITARGCPYHCRWCSHSTFGKTHRRRSAVARGG